MLWIPSALPRGSQFCRFCEHHLERGNTAAETGTLDSVIFPAGEEKKSCRRKWTWVSDGAGAGSDELSPDLSCPHGNVWEEEGRLGNLPGGASRNWHQCGWIINMCRMEEVRTAGAPGIGE